MQWDTKFNETQNAMRHKMQWDTKCTETQNALRHKMQWDTKCNETQNALRHKMQWDTNALRHKVQWDTKCNETQNSMRHKMRWDTKCNETQNALRHKIFWLCFILFTSFTVRCTCFALKWHISQEATVKTVHGVTKLFWTNNWSVLPNYRAIGTHGCLCVTYTVTLTFCDEYSRQTQQITSKVSVHYVLSDVLLWRVCSDKLQYTSVVSAQRVLQKNWYCGIPHDCSDIPAFNFNRTKITIFSKIHTLLCSSIIG